MSTLPTQTVVSTQTHSGTEKNITQMILKLRNIQQQQNYFCGDPAMLSSATSKKGLQPRKQNSKRLASQKKSKPNKAFKK
jgi:hypothetical protein